MGLRHAPARHPSDHRSRRSRAVAGGLVLLAALTLVAPLPTAALVGWRAGYAQWQPAVTSISGRAPVAAIDVALALAVLTLVVAARRRGARLRRLAVALTVLGAFGWLLFLSLWGWHYQVPTLERRLRVEPRELSAPRAEAFVRTAIAQLNDLHAVAHATPWPTRDATAVVVGPHVTRVLPSLGVTWQPAWPAPKRTLLDGYFRWAGIDGMTNPFGLDVVLNSRVLPFELPALAAHEYGHLAGFADESDASVVAWLACQDGSVQLRYSGALAVLPHLLTGVPSATRRRLLDGLGEGPRRDLQAIARRLQEQQPWVRAFAWVTYDRFLKANRVEEGVARYDAVARVLIGVAEPATGRLQREPRPWPEPRSRP